MLATCDDWVNKGFGNLNMNEYRDTATISLVGRLYLSYTVNICTLTTSVYRETICTISIPASIWTISLHVQLTVTI